MQETEKYAGYLFVYFKGEEYEDGEQIYFAISKENDPMHWQLLNGGRPVLISDQGEKGIRDPYMVRSPHGDRFYIVATDLRIYADGDWQRAITTGSRSIIVWDSENLIDWSDQRMVEVAPEGAGCAWAPEVFYDANLEQYYVFWASKLDGQESADKEHSYHQMLYCTTKDFKTFSKSEVYMDYGHAIIDTTMIAHNGDIYRFTKGHNVFQESGNSFNDPNFNLINGNVEQAFMARGEGPIIFKSNLEEKWYLFIDEFGLRGYIPLETTDLDSGAWKLPEQYDFPEKFRHGSIIPITLAEYDRLLRKFG